MSNPNEAVFVAQIENEVRGWMHISVVEPLESPAFAEIRGIVVKEEYRRKGIGLQLIQKAENWASAQGYRVLRIRTNIKRVETRRYYTNLNFVLKKTQEVFEKYI